MWAYKATFDSNYLAYLRRNNSLIRLMTFWGTDASLGGLFLDIALAYGNAVLLVLGVGRFQYSLQRVMNPLARRSCVPLRGVGKIYIRSSRGGLTDLSEFRYQDLQGIAIFNVVRKKLLFQFGVSGSLPLHSPNNGLQTRSVRTAPARPEEACQFLERVRPRREIDLCKDESVDIDQPTDDRININS